jgi:hypothetical protein
MQEEIFALLAGRERQIAPRSGLAVKADQPRERALGSILV